MYGSIGIFTIMIIERNNIQIQDITAKIHETLSYPTTDTCESYVSCRSGSLLTSLIPH